MYIGAILITQWNDNSEKTAKLNSASFIRELSQIQQTINWFSICVYTPHETFIHIIMKTSIERSVWTIIYHLFICWNWCVPVLTLFKPYKSVSLVEKSKVYSHIHTYIESVFGYYYSVVFYSLLICWLNVFGCAVRVCTLPNLLTSI